MAFGVLCGYLFLNKQENGTTYNMYRLVHFILRIWVKRQGNAKKQIFLIGKQKAISG